MFSSVLITGDAGGLHYIDDVLTETPRQGFNYCCACALPEYNGETDLRPIKKPGGIMK